LDDKSGLIGERIASLEARLPMDREDAPLNWPREGTGLNVVIRQSGFF